MYNFVKVSHNDILFHMERLFHKCHICSCGCWLWVCFGVFCLLLIFFLQGVTDRLGSGCSPPKAIQGSIYKSGFLEADVR